MQLARALLVLAVLATPAFADTSFESKIQVYADSDHTQVVSPVVQGSADITPDTSINLGYLADVVTSASVDLVTQASPTTIHDTRHQVSAGLTHLLGTLTLHGNYSFSRENDYLSHTLAASASKELFDKNTTLAVGYGLSLNTVGRAEDANFARSLTVQSLSLTWTQILSERALAQFGYELGYANGFQSSPYRYVPVKMSVDSAPEFWVPETDPDTRYRHAFVVGYNHAVGEDSSVQFDYRFYHDTWGITSHTIGARYFVNLSKKTELRFRERYYTQGAANFYQDNYTQTQMYMALDREMSPLWSNTLGVKLNYLFSPHVEGELKLDGFYYSYSDFPPLSNRTGVNTGIGLGITY